MGETSDERKQRYKVAFRVAYEFLLKYTDRIPETADEWSQLVDDMGEGSRAVRNDQIGIDLIVAAANEIERISSKK